MPNRKYLYRKIGTLSTFAERALDGKDWRSTPLILCDKCGTRAPGNSYHVYYGKAVDQRSHSWGGIYHSETDYKILGNRDVSICQKCLSRYILRNYYIFPFLLSTVVGLTLVSVGPLWDWIAYGISYSWDWDSVGIRGFVVFAGIVLVSIALDSDTTTIARSMAKGIVKGKFDLADVNGYWTASEYAQLHSKGKVD